MTLFRHNLAGLSTSAIVNNMSNYEQAMHPESGSKILLESVTDGVILACLRDNDPTIPYPNMWDLPGGGVEPDETLLACAERELLEEFGIRVPLSLLYVEHSLVTPGKLMGRVHGYLTPRDISRIAFGPEGQMWGLFTRNQLAKLPFVPSLRDFCFGDPLALTA